MSVVAPSRPGGPSPLHPHPDPNASRVSAPVSPRPGGPSPHLPLGYLVCAAAFFVAAAAQVPCLAPELTGHYYQPRLFALTHTLTLGWITLAIMGASYQLIPVTLG